MNNFAFENFSRLTWLYALLALVVISTSLSFAAAFAACALRARNRRRENFGLRVERKYARLLADLLDRRTSPADVSKQVAPNEALHFIELTNRFAARARPKERALLVATVSPFLSRLRQRIEHGDETQRIRAAQTLAELSSGDYDADLSRAMADPSDTVVLAIAVGFCRRKELVGSTPTFDVMRILERVENLNPRFAAGLLASAGSTIVPALRQMLEAEQASVSLRAVAADAIALLKDPSASDIAARVASSSATPLELRAASLRMLGSTGPSPHIPMAHHLTTDGEPVLRMHAVTALGRSADSNDLRMVKNALNDPSPWVAFHAAQALMRSGNEETLKQMANTDGPRMALAREVLTRHGAEWQDAEAQPWHAPLATYEPATSLPRLQGLTVLDAS